MGPLADAVREADVTVRPPTRADLAAIGDLFAAVKNRTRPTGYEEWHLFGTPWGDSPALAAFLEDMCIGLYLMLPSALRLGRETVPAVQAMDVMVHPRFRLQGVFAQLASATVGIAEGRGFEVVYGFPNETSFPIYIRHRNAQHVGDVVSYAVYTGGRQRWWRQTTREPALGALELDPVRPSDEDLERLIEAVHDQPEACRVEKTPRYLDWRYGSPSGDTYEWLTLRDRSGAAVAAALTGDRSAEPDGGTTRVTRVHEMFAGSSEHASLLLRLAITRAAGRGAAKVQVLVKDPVVEGSLPGTGLRPESVVHFVLRKLTTRIQGGNVHHFPFWRLISGDMDVY
jgi:GNAT superfamily N-acetyltransferase